MKKTRLNRLFLTVLLVATIMSLTSFYLIPCVNALPTLEDFTIYTEVDPGVHITVTNSTHIDCDLWNDEDAYVYEDKGIANFVVNFAHEIDFYWDSAGVDNTVKGGVWVLTNDVDDWKGLADASKTFLGLYVERSVAPIEQLYLAEVDSGTTYTDASVDLNQDVWLYLTVERSGTAFTCEIYSTSGLRDAGAAGDIDTLTLTLHTTPTFRYIFACMSYNTGGAGGARKATVELRNLNLQYSYEYVFYGLYDETTGFRDGAVNVTSYYPEGISPITFGVDGDYTYGSYNKPTYFLFNLTNNREYWLGANEDTATIYIFDDSTTTYTISFMDFAGILDEFSYIEAQRYVNATLRIVEKRQVDVENKIIMNLVNGVLYTIIIGDGQEYTYGDLRMTSDTTVTLTLKSVDFPKETLLTYNYVRIYGLRAFGESLNYALSFDGTDDYVEIPDTVPLRLVGNCSFEFWIQTTDNGTMIINKHLDIAPWTGWGIMIRGTDGTVGYWSSNSAIWAWSSVVIDDDELHHIVITVEGDAVVADVNFYIDGSFTNTVVSAIPESDNEPLRIGCNPAKTAFAEVILDEVHLYNRTITSSEVSYSYNSGNGRYFPLNSTGLVGWWHFDEGTGNTAYDETANNHDGTIYGASWVTSTIAIGPGTITITYEDTLELTTSVDIYINYRNGTTAYNATVATDSFVHTWASAENDVDYAVVCDIDHQRYGEYDWRQYFPRSFSAPPWGLGFLGTLPFDTAYILPVFLILFVGGCFTVINAQLGAFVTVVTACILAYIGWLPIPAATLIVAFTLAILMALIYAKRRVTIG